MTRDIERCPKCRRWRDPDSGAVTWIGEDIERGQTVYQCHACGYSRIVRTPEAEPVR